jgi:hypothetical protein
MRSGSVRERTPCNASAEVATNAGHVLACDSQQAPRADQDRLIHHQPIHGEGAPPLLGRFHRRGQLPTRKVELCGCGRKSLAQHWHERRVDAGGADESGTARAQRQGADCIRVAVIRDRAERAEGEDASGHAGQHGAPLGHDDQLVV